MRPRTLSDFEGEYRESGEQFNFKDCPVCGSHGWNLYVNPKNGKWFCFARQHGAGGVIAVTDLSDERRLELLHRLADKTEGPQVWPEVFMPAHHPLSDMALSYLERRKISVDLAKNLGMGEMNGQSRILIPYFGEQGRIIHWVGRQYIDCRVTKTSPKYLAASGPKPGYLLPRWQEVDELVLVEGPLDAIAVYRATGIPTMSIGGTSLSKRIEADIRRLVHRRLQVILDGDALLKAFDIERQLYDKFDVTIYKLPYDQDPASVGSDYLRELLYR